MIYAAGKSPFKALPVANVRLTVGNFSETQKANSTDTEVTFDVPLDKADYEVKAELLDAKGKVLAGAYYVYCGKTGDEQR